MNKSSNILDIDTQSLSLEIGEDMDKLLLACHRAKASDVIFKTGDSVWARIHGEWVKVMARPVSKSMMTMIIANISGENDTATMVLSGKDLDFAYEIKETRAIRKRFRVNATAARAVNGETGISITLRTIPEHPPKLDDLDLPKEMQDAFFPQYGLVLVTGPVGSGKSTLLFSVLREIAETRPSHIITYEDPIEFNITSLPERKGPVEQTEVGRHIQSFTVAPRNSLRRAGDVVLFGESRDAETIRSMSIEAETGVAVYSTVHTNSVSETISRLVRTFPEDEHPSMIASLVSATRLIVNQRLLIRADGKGRIAVREWLVFDQEVVSRLERLSVSQMIPETRKIVNERGTSMLHDLTNKFEKGFITQDEFDKYKRSLGIIGD